MFNSVLLLLSLLLLLLLLNDWSRSRANIPIIKRKRPKHTYTIAERGHRQTRTSRTSLTRMESKDSSLFLKAFIQDDDTIAQGSRFHSPKTSLERKNCLCLVLKNSLCNFQLCQRSRELQFIRNSSTIVSLKCQLRFKPFTV